LQTVRTTIRNGCLESVVFTDVDMPGRLNGFQLARHIQDHHHDGGQALVAGEMAAGVSGPGAEG
jgi:hypothetical protein